MDFLKNFYRSNLQGRAILMVLSACFLFVSLFFFPSFQSAFEVPKLAAWLVIFGGLFLIRSLRDERTSSAGFRSWVETSVSGKIFFFSLIGFLLWSVLGAIVSSEPLSAIFGFYNRYTNGLMFFLLWAVFLLFLLKNCSQKDLWILRNLAILIGAIISLVAIAEVFGLIWFSDINLGAGRAVSLLGNPSFSAMFIAAVFPWGLAGIFSQKRLVFRIYYTVVVIIMLLSLIFLASRGSFVGLAAGALAAILLLILLRGSRKAVLGFAVSVFVLAGLFWLSTASVRTGNFADLFSSKDVNIEQRLYVWDIAREAIWKYPVFGVGLGNFQSWFEGSRGKHLAGLEGIFDDPHNLFLHLAATGGLPLLFFFLCVIGSALVIRYQRLKSTKDKTDIADIASLVVWLVVAAFTPVPVPLFFLLTIVLAILLKPSLEGDFIVRRSSNNFFSAVRILSFLIACFFIVWGLMLFSAEFYFHKGWESFRRQQYFIAYWEFQTAGRINPFNQEYAIYTAAAMINAKLPPGQIEKQVLKVVRIRSTEANTWAEAANLYYAQYFMTKERKYLYWAIGVTNIALNKDPFFAGRYGKLATYYMYLGQLNRAADLLQYEISMKNDDLFAWLLLAGIYQTQGLPEQFLNALEAAYKLAPNLQPLRSAWQSAKNGAKISEITLPVYLVKP